jgi:hypothetical protein
MDPQFDIVRAVDGPMDFVQESVFFCKEDFGHHFTGSVLQSLPCESGTGETIPRDRLTESH